MVVSSGSNNWLCPARFVEGTAITFHVLFTSILGLVLVAPERDLIFRIHFFFLDAVYVCSLTSLRTGHTQMVSYDDAFGQIIFRTSIVFQEFRLESL